MVVALFAQAAEVFRPALQQTPIIVRIAPTQDPTGIASVLVRALGLTGALVVGALIAGALVAGILFAMRSRKPLDH
jgi:hypothetical protein